MHKTNFAQMWGMCTKLYDETSSESKVWWCCVNVSEVPELLLHYFNLKNSAPQKALYLPLQKTPIIKEWIISMFSVFFFLFISITYIFSKGSLRNQFKIFSLFELLLLFVIFCCSKSSNLVCVSSNFALAENNF